jgi:hypothetical protein
MKLKLAFLFLLGFTAQAHTLPFSFLGSQGGPDGVLHVTNGQTVTIPSNVYKDYTSCTIDSGGTLQMVGTTDSHWAEFRCRGDLVENGTIKYTWFDNSGSSGTITKTSSYDSSSLSWSFTQATGGNGDCTSAAYGNGGGGAGGDDDGTCSDCGTNATQNKGGDGGQCCGSGPAIGGSIFGNIGGTGYTSSCYRNDAAYTGGGGGARGYSGGPINVIVGGNYSGNGVWNISGSNGGEGPASGAGRGGGGAGGAGGKVWIHLTGSNSFSGTYSQSGGTGGVGAFYGSNGSSGCHQINGGSCI